MTGSTVKIRWGRWGLLLAGAAVAGYWYWSPLLAVQQLKSAARSSDATTFNSLVDYPRLRESLKTQLAALMADAVATKAGGDDAASRAGVALGQMLGQAMLDKVVDTVVRPEAMMQAMQQGRLGGAGGRAGGAGSGADGNGPRPAGDPADIEWQSERPGPDRFILQIWQRGDASGKRVGLVLERSGFADWKLTGLQLPSPR